MLTSEAGTMEGHAVGKVVLKFPTDHPQVQLPKPSMIQFLKDFISKNSWLISQPKENLICTSSVDL